MTGERVNLIAILGCILLLVVIVELIRQKHLRERYALIWVVTGVILLLIAVYRDLLIVISQFLGFSLPSNALFFFLILFLVLISLGLSVISSKITERNKILTQEVVLLKKRVEDLEKASRS